MNEKLINDIAFDCYSTRDNDFDVVKFAKLIINECIDKIETYHIPVGNSAAGEMACEWTYNALTEIKDDIKEQFGIT